MTGLHALHMIIGVGIFTCAACTSAWKGALRPSTTRPVENRGLVLALRRHRLDLSVSVAVPDRPAQVRSSMSEHIIPSENLRGHLGCADVLTVVTAGVAFIDLGPFNTVVALVIATFKAVLVVLFFMHVKYTSEQNDEGGRHFRGVLVADSAGAEPRGLRHPGAGVNLRYTPPSGRKSLSAR